jgi:acyl-CoA thioester hydrolase
MGVVYHANYFVWFEMGRVEFLRHLGFDYKQMELTDDCHLPVVEAICRYKAPAHYDEVLTVETRVAAMRSGFVRFTYRLIRPDPDSNAPTLLADAETTHFVVDGKMQKRQLPEKYASALRAALQ